METAGGEMKKGEVNKDLEQLAKELKARTDLPLTPLSLGKIFTIGASASLEPFIRAGLKSVGSIVERLPPPDARF